VIVAVPPVFSVTLNVTGPARHAPVGRQPPSGVSLLVKMYQTDVGGGVVV